MTRRQWLGAAVSIGAVPPGDKVIIGVMGIGGRGSQLTEFFAKHPGVEIAWLCDVDQRRFARAAKIVEGSGRRAPRTTADFRRILDDRDVHAVVNATPEHWHSVSAVMICQAGKDLYLEKAVSHSLWEGRKAVEAARKYKRVVQIGLQTRSAPYRQSAADFIRSGKLGKVHLVRVHNLLGQRKALHRQPDPPAPAGLNWDMWVGPAPYQPYNPIYLSRLLWDYDGGSLTGDTVHQLDLARAVLGKGYPKAVQHAGGKFVFAGDDSEQPDTRMISFEYDDMVVSVEHTEATPYMKKIPAEIRDGTQMPEWYPFTGTRVEIFGTNGLMLLGRVGGGWQVFGPNGEKGPSDKSTHIRMQLDHVADFVNCVRTRERPKCDVEEGHISAALCHMASISYRVGNRRLVFDAASETFPGDAEANRYLKRAYRKPWVIPDQV